MRKVLALVAFAAAASALPAQAAEFRFDFTGTVLAETRPNLTVAPQPITGNLVYTAPEGGNVATNTGSASLFTDLYGNFFFSSYTATLSNTLFTFSGSDSGSQRFSVRASALPDGSFGFVNASDGFSLTGTPVNASGRLSGSFTPAETAVPEPGSWLLMLGGFGALGAMLRRRRRTSVSLAT